jgi:hypothetical protein
VYYSKETTNTPTRVIMGVCPYCKQPARMMLYKAKTSGCIWIIPYSSSPDYSINCGHCFARFRIPNEMGVDIENGKHNGKVTAFIMGKDGKLSTYLITINQDTEVGIGTDTNHFFKCSECGNTRMYINQYCPNCGSSGPHIYYSRN